MPGTQVQRYMVTYQDPYLNNQPLVFGLSGFYYQRIYTEWTEQRVGGSVSLGYQFTHDLTGTLRFQGQDVKIENPEYPVPSLLEVLGHNQLYTFSASLQHDTRDNPFLATEGHLISATFEETVGTFQYPRASVEFSQFYRIFQRADRSGNHVLNLQLRAGYSGDNTPIFERFYAGGFSTIRGFAFRGVSPLDPVYGMGVGGDFQMLATAEYLFPITADDMLKGVVFCRYRHGRADDQQVDGSGPRGPRLRPADFHPDDGPRPDRPGLRLPDQSAARRPDADVQLLRGLQSLSQV